MVLKPVPVWDEKRWRESERRYTHHNVHNMLQRGVRAGIFPVDTPTDAMTNILAGVITGSRPKPIGASENSFALLGATASSRSKPAADTGDLAEQVTGTRQNDM